MENKFKIRCSAIGQIMTQPRTKKDKESGLLSDTAKSYCQMWLKEQLYNRKLMFSNKYTQKGIIVEDDSIDFMSTQFGYGQLFKNEKHFSNNFMTGTPDVIIKDAVIDVKNSYSWETFPTFENEIPTKGYYYQLQGYMTLLGKDNAKLVYLLTDTPDHLIKREAWSYANSNGYEIEDIYEQIEIALTYSDVADNLKIKTFDIARDNEVINQIEQQVIKCRNYIDELLKNNHETRI